LVAHPGYALAMDRQTRAILVWAAKWTAVYVANAAVPVVVWLASAGSTSGRRGMLAAVWVLWAEGVVLGAVSARFRSYVVPGGMMLAAAQVCPVPQLGAALAVTSFADTVFAHGRWDGAYSFSAAVAGGHLLIGLAFLLGVPNRVDQGCGDRPAENLANRRQ
jgi:hypothetical protein